MMVVLLLVFCRGFYFIHMTGFAVSVPSASDFFFVCFLGISLCCKWRFVSAAKKEKHYLYCSVDILQLDAFYDNQNYM